MKLFSFLPVFEEKNFALKVVLLLSIIAVSFFLTSLFGLLMAVPFFGLDAILNLGNLDTNEPQNINFLKYLQVVNQLGIFIIPAIVYGYLMNHKATQYLLLSKKIPYLSLIISILIVFAFIPGINWLVALNEKMVLPESFWRIEEWMRHSEEQTKILTKAFLMVETPVGLAGNLLVIALLAAVGEEMLFRGIVLQLINEGLKNIHLAVIISAILFSALHMQFYGFLPRFVIGIVFGYIFVWTRNLWVPVILHFIFNAMSVVAAYLYQTGVSETDMDSFGTTDSAILISGSLIFTIALMYILYRKRNPLKVMSEY